MLGIGRTDLASGALLLFATNWLAIVFAAGIVFALAGFGAHRGARGRFQGSLAGAGLVVLLIILAVPLGLNAIQRWGDSNANRIAAEVINEWDSSLALENLVVDTTADPTQVVVDLAGSAVPEETDALADSLASSLEEPVILRLRFRPEFVAGEIGID